MLSLRKSSKKIKNKPIKYNNATRYVCSNCGAGAGYGNEAYISCGCYGTWVNDGRGGFYDSWNFPKPIPEKDYKRIKND